MRAGKVYVNRVGRQRVPPIQLRQVIDQRLTTVFVTEPSEMPVTWHFYAVINKDVHFKMAAAAAEMGAEMVCLPAANAYMAAKVLDMASAGRDVCVFQPAFLGDRA